MIRSVRLKVTWPLDVETAKNRDYRHQCQTKLNCHISNKVKQVKYLNLDENISLKKIEIYKIH